MSEAQIKSKTFNKLFLGCILDSELKMHLKESVKWQDAKISNNDLNGVQEVFYDNKKFIGTYLKEEKIVLDALKDYESMLTLEIASCCPCFDCSKLKFIIFSQFFIS